MERKHAVCAVRHLGMWSLEAGSWANTPVVKSDKNDFKFVFKKALQQCAYPSSHFDKQSKCVCN